MDQDGTLLGWPGFGDEPPDAGIRSLSGLASYALRRISEPADLVAQSMGGVVALEATLRQPGLVRRLVLAGTSGGVDMKRFGAQDWRADYAREMPETAPRWFIDDRTDLTGALPGISQPVLLLWGEDDKVSPPAVARYLQALLPDAELVLVPGAGHMLAEEAPDQVASAIADFLGRTAVN